MFLNPQMKQKCFEDASIEISIVRHTCGREWSSTEDHQLSPWALRTPEPSRMRPVMLSKCNQDSTFPHPVTVFGASSVPSILPRRIIIYMNHVNIYINF